MKPSRFFLVCAAGLLAAALAEAGLRYYSRSSEEQRRQGLEQTAARLEQSLSGYQLEGLRLLKEVLLADQVAGALQSKTFNQLIQLGFLLQAIQKQSSIPGVEICVLDENGKLLGGGSRLREIDSSVVTLGRFGEEKMFARSGDSFFDAVYFEGIAPLVKKGQVAGFAHIEMPVGRGLLERARDALQRDVFLIRRDRIEGDSLDPELPAAAREQARKLLRREPVPSLLRGAVLELAADRNRPHWIGVDPSAAVALVPLRGVGGEVVAALMTVVPEAGVLAYRDAIRRGVYWAAAFFAALLLIKIGLRLALALSRLTWKTIFTVLLGGIAFWGAAWAGLRGGEAALWRRAEKKNDAVMAAVREAARDYGHYYFASVGRERDEMKRNLLAFLRGESVPKPSFYEFSEIPLGLREKSAASRPTLSRVPVRWSGAGVFLEKAGSPFSREAGVYKVPVGRFAQKLWVVYSSAWGYLNKFGSPYGTTIGRVQVVFENGGALDFELKNGVNAHDRFSPPTQLGEVESQKAFEFVSEEDPLHRVQYVEELEIAVPPLYAGSKVEYVVFRDEETADVPIFYSLTLGTKKGPAAAPKPATLIETERHLRLRDETARRLAGASFLFDEGEAQARAETVVAGTPALVSHWSLPERGAGRVGVVTPAPYVKSLRNASRFLDWGMALFLAVVGIIGATQVIVSWKKLRFKLVSFSLLVSCVPVLLVAWIMGGAMRQREEAALRGRAAAALEQAELFLADLLKRAEDISLRLCHDPQLLAGVGKGEKEKIEQILSEMKVTSFADFPGSFAVVRRHLDNRVVEEWGTASYRSLPQGAKSLLEGVSSGLLLSPAGCAALGVSQIFDPEGAADPRREHVSVAVGVPLDPLFLSDLKRRTLADIALFVEDNLKAATGKTPPAAPTQLYAGLLRENKRQFAFSDAGDAKSATAFAGLKEGGGRLSGMLAATVSQEKAFLAGFASRKTLFAAGFLILALAGLMSYIISRSITSPIGILSKGAEEIARGGLGAQIGVPAKDEIGNLASSFNRMSASLKENRDHLEQKIADLLTLQKLSAKLSSVLDKEELMHLVVKLFGELSGFSKGMLLLRDPETHRWVVMSGVGIRRGDFGKLSYLPEETLAGQAVRERKMLHVENHLRDERVPAASAHRKSSEKPLQILALPLLAKGNEVGAVVLEHPCDSDHPVRVDEVLLSTLAHHAAIALENARLYEMAVEDGLTKVFVSRYFHFRLKEEVEHAKRYKTHLALVLLDLDYFKTVNDTYGHQIGDKILVAAAQLMKKTFRSTDVVCRYGGDEFAVILPKTTGEEAVLIAERLRHEIEKLDFAVDPKIVLRVTLSVGVAAWNAPMGKEELIQAADHALYAAKTGGRNRVSRFEQTA